MRLLEFANRLMLHYEKYGDLEVTVEGFDSPIGFVQWYKHFGQEPRIHISEEMDAGSLR